MDAKVHVVSGIAIKRESTAAQVARALRELILTGEFRPGMRLAEAPLVESLGVARGTLREALATLAAEGIVKQEVQRGAVVNIPTADDLEDISGARRLLEMAGIEASLEGETAHFERLVYALEAMRAATRELETANSDRADWFELAAADIEFHLGLVAFLNNRQLSRFAELMYRQLRVLMGLIQHEFHAEPSTVLDDHESIYVTLRDKDLAAAEDVLDRHLAEASAQLLYLLQSVTGPERSGASPLSQISAEYPVDHPQTPIDDLPGRVR